jgi:hypothetical protein
MRLALTVFCHAARFDVGCGGQQGIAKLPGEQRVSTVHGRSQGQSGCVGTGLKKARELIVGCRVGRLNPSIGLLFCQALLRRPALVPSRDWQAQCSPSRPPIRTAPVLPRSPPDSPPAARLFRAPSSGCFVTLQSYRIRISIAWRCTKPPIVGPIEPPRSAGDAPVPTVCRHIHDETDQRAAFDGGACPPEAARKLRGWNFRLGRSLRFKLGLGASRAQQSNRAAVPVG